MSALFCNGTIKRGVDAVDSRTPEDIEYLEARIEAMARRIKELEAELRLSKYCGLCQFHSRVNRHDDLNCVCQCHAIKAGLP